MRPMRGLLRHLVWWQKPGVTEARRPVEPPDCTFIETKPGESEDEWLSAVDGLLVQSMGTPRTEWMKYRAGPVVRWSGREFRSFQCRAGSVHARLMLAAERGELCRGLLYLATRMRDNRFQCTALMG